MRDTDRIRPIIQQIDSLPVCGSYGIVRQAVAGGSPDLLRELTRTLTENFEPRIARLRIPDSILPLYGEDVARIARGTETNDDSFYNPNRDVFIKDLCIAAQRLIPAGAQVVHEQFVARRPLVSRGLRTALAAARLYLRAGRLSPFYEIHTHDLTLQEFNEEGWRRCYRRIADLLELNPHVKGVVGSAWFFDPALAQVSPRLAYLRSIPIENGALSVRLGSDRQSIALATKTSQTRRQLYESGKYLPTSFMLVWYQKDLRRWAAAQKD